MSIYSVYWIHLPFHTDPLTEGYIGITNNFERRREEHFLKSTRFPPGSVMDLLEECDRETARAKEFEMRPRWHIGWNGAPGGMIGGAKPGRKTGWKQSGESNKKRSKFFKGNKYGNKETVVEGLVFESQKSAANYLVRKYNVSYKKARFYTLKEITLDELLTDQRVNNGDGFLFNGHRGLHWAKKRGS